MQRQVRYKTGILILTVELTLLRKMEILFMLEEVLQISEDKTEIILQRLTLPQL